MPKTREITLVIPCKGRAAHVLSSIPILESIFENILVVDYNCPENISEQLKNKFPKIRCIKEENAHDYNAAKARNIGLRKVDTNFVFFKDADIIPSQDFIKNLGEINYYEYFALMGRHRALGANGSILVPTDSALKIEGYDEFFKGYGQEDIDFFERLKMLGLEPAYLPAEPERILSHKVEDREKFHDLSRPEALLRNRVYGFIKRDLMALSRSITISERYRDYLRKRSDEAVTQAMTKNLRSLKISIAPKFPEQEYFSKTNGGPGTSINGYLNRKITYEFRLL